MPSSDSYLPDQGGGQTPPPNLLRCILESFTSTGQEVSKPLRGVIEESMISLHISFETIPCSCLEELKKIQEYHPSPIVCNSFLEELKKRECKKHHLSVCITVTYGVDKNQTRFCESITKHEQQINPDKDKADREVLEEVFNLPAWRSSVESTRDVLFRSIIMGESTCSLYELITKGEHDKKLWKAKGYPSKQLFKLMRDIVSELVRLHNRGIVHPDLKPQNVFVLIRGGEEEPFRISDMGTRNATGSGTSRWLLPEELSSGQQTPAANMFSLGCVLGFCIGGGGQHPFRVCNKKSVKQIKKSWKNLSSLFKIPEAVDLVSRLLNPNPIERPEARYVEKHPLFWESERRLSFLGKASDWLEREGIKDQSELEREGIKDQSELEREREGRKDKSDLSKALGKVANVAVGGKWNEKMHPEFIKYLTSEDEFRKRWYNNYYSVRKLLRVIRNKDSHYFQLPSEIRDLLGSYPVGFDDYFSSRFPKLLIEVYKLVSEYGKEEECFHAFTK